MTCVVGPREWLSPSGKYRLVVTTYTTRPGAWDGTLGVVSRVPDGSTATGLDTEIARVKRNYHSFQHTWIENHPNGHDYLVCGEDYQGQTVIELDTGARRDHLPPEAEQGHAFCWIDSNFHAPTRTLVVMGCIWACPYEFRFHDFSSPMDGWPEIGCDEYIDDDVKWPELRDDGTLRCFETAPVRLPGDEDDDEEQERNRPTVDRAIKTLRREGQKLVLVDEWVSVDEQASREKREAGRLAFEQWKTDFRAHDPLYLRYQQLLASPMLSPDDYESYGVTYDGWCSDFKVQETRWCRRIVKHTGKKGYTIDLEWGAKTGPIKLDIYKDGNRSTAQFFEHSVAGMNEAFAVATRLASMEEP